MTDLKHMITPERMGLWVVASFIIALLALVVAVVSIQQQRAATYLSQLQIVQLNQKIEALHKNDAAKAPVAQEAKK